ncbi:hypothetical protein Tco_0845347 [Tanacetum coccineum]
MDMDGYEVPHVLVTCRSRQIDDENVPLNYSINNDLSIQFSREEFCLLTGLRFGVENREEYDTPTNLPFRRRVFPSHLDGQPITGIDIENAIEGPTFAELYNEDVVGLCCLGILVAAWRKKKGRFTSEMVFGFFQGNITVARLTPNDIEARSDWWISSKAYFDGFIDQVERVPFDLSRHNMYEIPSGVYRHFVEQKIELERNKKDVHDIKEEIQKFGQEMNVRSVRQENTVPIIVGQHYGLSNFSKFRSMHGGLSSFMNMGTPPNFLTPMRSQPGSSNWQRQMPEQSTSHYWQPSSHPGSYNSFAQVPSHMGRPNLQTTIDTQHDVDGIVDQNIPNRGKRQQIPGKYLVTPFTVQAPTTMGYNEEENNVTFFGSQFTSNILFYENVDHAKVRRENYENMELLIRRSPLNVNWTVAYTSTISVHLENNQFIIVNDVIGTLDGSRSVSFVNDVNWVFLSIHVAGNHWATSVIDLANKAGNTK